MYILDLINLKFSYKNLIIIEFNYYPIYIFSINLTKYYNYYLQ